MLSSKNRIQKTLFEKISQNGSLKQSKFFSAKCFRLEKTLNEKRFSIVISKKVLKTATDRNLLKRRVYSILRGFLSKITPAVSIVFYPKKGIETVLYSDLKKEIEGFLKGVGVIE